MANERQWITFLPTEDLVQTAAFYQRVFGFELILKQSGCLILSINGSAFLGFCQQTDDPVEPDQRIMLTLVEDDVDGWYARLTEQGVPTDGPPRENPKYLIYHFFAIDPNGYRLEVQRFLDPRWQS